MGVSDEMTVRQFQMATAEGLTPILCVGETLAERDAGQTEAVVARQLDAVLSQVGVEGFKDAVIAYEPVWAIGTGRAASVQQAAEVHRFIRSRLAKLGDIMGDSVRILYGGSVKPANARELFQVADIDGGLIGGASLDAADFLAIGAAALG
jgi:triosephosphate isomerase